MNIITQTVKHKSQKRYNKTKTTKDRKAQTPAQCEWDQMLIKDIMSTRKTFIRRNCGGCPI